MTSAEPAPDIAVDAPLLQQTTDALPVVSASLTGKMGLEALQNFSSPIPQLFAPAQVVHAPIVPSWEAVVESGDTLGLMLARAKLEPALRADITAAVAAEYDLRKLQAGDRLSVAYNPDGTPFVVALGIADGVRVEVTLSDTIESRTVTPTATLVERAGTLSVDGSIYASLDKAGVPPRFATDLVRIMGDTIDFRRDLQGGESLNILWAQETLEDGSAVGEPQMSYASLDLVEETFEVVWPDEAGGQPTLYMNGEVFQTTAAPVKGARLSSVFGKRKHPVFGNVRMHTGVDYAAAQGTPISATAPGRVSFIGWRGGYGRVVEVSHGSGTMSRYAHLSAVQKGLEVGKRVAAGEMIGSVGQTGVATGPNLHYEVRVDGRPIDPLGEETFSDVADVDAQVASALLEMSRTRFSDALDAKS
ncbi:murein DD-endopeptidase MepM/ murein hydrolase activator NlpD [Sulfitobacter undariae]|uniref:Murein DD-endopeptidase MepM/ murein hydrolase activator NlpD n=1 Tax=Sulfitobacter undariae TaxID=1563671 RepID=A0A7W6E652_9RHOB|nr:M23 family metallopeptidase [Sulfitobacter undariae]MBB3995440.1 murein DD-endopeptidase MepM/ murein hydrolase activator NlpD [Sulfitobacter undariae]